MKLSDHVELIRSLIYKAFDNQFARLGVGANKMFDSDKLPEDLHKKRNKIEELIDSHTEETGSYAEAREKTLDELTFTLFNRLAAIKVMEAHNLVAPIVNKDAAHGDRSFGHKLWLEENPDMRQEDLEGIREYFKYEFNRLGESIPLFHRNYRYALLPYVIELNEIIDAFNAVALDPQVEEDIWQSDDVLGWLYESYNNVKKKAHKDSGDKTEYHKVSLQSQVYTPRWVVEFLVNNSLGKLYLEMYPNSDIANQYKIANAPKERIREIKPLHEIKLIDPASGSGNFLLYAFELFYALYIDQIENYGADYDEDDIPQLIIEHNLHGIDLDDRAIQLAHLGLWIKAKQKRRSIGNLKFNVVSTDFFLPDFEEVRKIFQKGVTDSKQLEVVEEIWGDLQQAYKFGSLVRLEEKISLKLHGIKDQQSGVTLFGEQELEEYERFKKDFFINIETAVATHAKQQGSSFLTDKTKDAITFLRLITQRYDVATANPPYTDSSDFGVDLKKFINENYSKPYKFHTNLYATFILRCFELTNEDGRIAMIHPYSFMFIKTFEDVRELMIKHTLIEVLADWGLDRVNIFEGGYASAPTFYVLNKKRENINSVFFQLTNGLQEKEKKPYFFKSLENYRNGYIDKFAYEINQESFKIVKSWPLIYWISDEFREKFKGKSLEDYFKVTVGLMTGNNLRFLRFNWEIEESNISKDYSEDNKRWIPYQKGGPFQKWYGNNWLLVDYQNNGKNLASKSNSAYYFREGITYSALGSGSFRFLEKNNIFDIGGSCIFSNEFENIEYSIALFNSKLTSYVTKCFNPTVNTQVGDLKRVPFVRPNVKIEQLVSKLASRNMKIEKKRSRYTFYEKHYKDSPFVFFQNGDFKRTISIYFNFDNYLHTQIIINEAIINEKIFEVYELTDSDKAMVLAKEGESIGAMPVSKKAKQAYLANELPDFPLDHIRDYIEALPEKEFDATEREKIEKELPQLYQGNNDLEEFCIRHQVNPINVWYWFRESNVIPQQRMNTLAMEFLADMIREILMEDEDGIIPLVPNAGEKVLLDRIEEKFIEKGFTMAQYSSFDSVLGRELNDYINNYFFKALSDHLNLFMYLPKTPFIWHLTSGPEQGFDCYIIIYKWNRDKLYSIRSRYIEQRERSLQNRQSDLRAKSEPSAAEQNELDKIFKQLKEIEAFKEKIDDLLAEGYNPILDDGVGKNIAPLQKRKMIPYDVLTKGELKKYLNADW